MRKNTILKTIYGAYAYPVPLAVRLERHSRKGNIKQAMRKAILHLLPYALTLLSWLVLNLWIWSRVADGLY